MNSDVMFSHKSDDWATPSSIYDYFMGKGWFDPCPLKCDSFDGLSVEWKNHNFVNPPYSNIMPWVKKAAEEAFKGKTSIFLVPARTDTRWFKELFGYSSDVFFIQGRLKFNDSKDAPFPSAIFIVRYSDRRIRADITTIDCFLEDLERGIFNI